MNVLALSTVAIFALSAVISLSLTPLVRQFARERGWVDRPDGRRKKHTEPVPRIGGLAIYSSFVLASAFLLLFGPHDPHDGGMATDAYLHLAVAGAAVLAVGLVDDLRGVRPAVKILVQTVAAIYLYWNGYQVTNLSNPFGGDSLPLAWLSLPVTVLWFVGMSNAFNLIDGLDGLAAGIGFFSTTALFIASLINERWEVALLATALAGALLGFLRYNFNPASIFLGDSGALFVGFVLAAIAVRGSMKSSAAIAVAAPLMALALPILDATIAVLRRAIAGKRLFEGDADHIHHRLLRKGLTPRRVVAILYGVAAAFGALSLLTMSERGQVVGLVILATSIVTWVGVQQLGYSEFGEVGRLLKQGLIHERKAMENNVYLRKLQDRFLEADTLDRLWQLAAEAASLLGFHGAALDIVHARVPREDASRVWRSSTAVPASEPATVWTIPLHLDGEVLGTLALHRRLASDQPQFESVCLLDAFAKGYAPRAHWLLERGPEDSANSDPCVIAGPSV